MEHLLNIEFYPKGFYLMCGDKKERNSVIIAEFYDLEALEDICEILNELNVRFGKDSDNI